MRAFLLGMSLATGFFISLSVQAVFNNDDQDECKYYQHLSQAAAAPKIPLSDAEAASRLRAEAAMLHHYAIRSGSSSTQAMDTTIRYIQHAKTSQNAKQDCLNQAMNERSAL